VARLLPFGLGPVDDVLGAASHPWPWSPDISPIPTGVRGKPSVDARGNVRVDTDVLSNFVLPVKMGGAGTVIPRGVVMGWLSGAGKGAARLFGRETAVAAEHGAASTFADVAGRTALTGDRAATRLGGELVRSDASKILLKGGAGVAVIGGGAWAIGNLAGNGVKAAGDALGQASTDIFGGIGQGLGNALNNFGQGLGQGAKALILPGIIVAGAFVAVKLLIAPKVVR
jgi:hypothetical protein